MCWVTGFGTGNDTAIDTDTVDTDTVDTDTVDTDTVDTDTGTACKLYFVDHIS